MPTDPTLVALLGPDPGAVCTTPACGHPDPCDECEERRYLASPVRELVPDARADLRGPVRPGASRRRVLARLVLVVARQRERDLRALAARSAGALVEPE
jgi:hypothetical protein